MLVLCIMQVHIGKKIKERAAALNIKPADLAEKINTSKQNMYGIFKRSSLDTALLSQLSKALDYDFFLYYQKSKSYKAEDSKLPTYEYNASVHQEIKSLRNDIGELKEKFDMLKSIVDLMKKQVK